MYKRRISILLLCIILITDLSASAFDIRDEKEVIISLQINNPIMEINGTLCELDEGRNTKPVIINGRTLIPIRSVIEFLGGNVDWSEEEKCVSLNLASNDVKLYLDNTIAYYNGKKKTLDVAPTVINSRTMLPLRFISESFNLGVSWNNETKTINIIRDIFTREECNTIIKKIPEYNGQTYSEINNGFPFFKEYEIIDSAFEYYCKQDSLKRCNLSFATVTEELMPSEPRKSISSVTPTGWINKQYEIVSGGYLYNRCHLIGFQLTGENANARNLITGTRYMNTESMLPFENEVALYIKDTGNSVVYRSTPIFEGDNLVAKGILLEAYSVEDYGEGICFCVFCYNVQPGINIDYKTGASSVY